MLLIKKLDVDGTILTHYVLITDLASLLYMQSKAKKRLYYCRRCLHHFRTEEKLDDHIKYCGKFDAQKTILIVKINTLNLKMIKIQFHLL